MILGERKVLQDDLSGSGIGIAVKVNLVVKTDFCGRVVMVLYGFPVFMVNGMRVGNNCSVGINMCMLRIQGLLHCKKVQHHYECIKQPAIFPDKNHCLNFHLQK